MKSMTSMKRKFLRILGLSLITIVATLMGFGLIGAAIQMGWFRFIVHISLTILIAIVILASFVGGRYLMETNKE